MAFFDFVLNGGCAWPANENNKKRLAINFISKFQSVIPGFPIPQSLTLN